MAIDSNGRSSQLADEFENQDKDEKSDHVAFIVLKSTIPVTLHDDKFINLNKMT